MQSTMRPSIRRAFTDMLPPSPQNQLQRLDVPPTPTWSPPVHVKAARVCKSGWLDTFDALDIGSANAEDYFSIPLREDSESSQESYRREPDQVLVLSTQPLHQHLSAKPSSRSLPSTPDSLWRLRQRYHANAGSPGSLASSQHSKHSPPTPPPSAPPPQINFKVKIFHPTTGDITAFRLARDCGIARVLEHAPSGTSLHVVRSSPGDWTSWHASPISDNEALRAIVASSRDTVRFVAL
ncbi:hypothetical protein BKA62DRAFT_242890 [Auriculariales sp. MPI-PUGE-AT-0066]|nr:hypothetical protein BKA62DRAFT_242890 [Auriculariales sp. MPI-PUGE-AT-0066]